RDPQKDDVARGDERVGRVERAQLRRLLRPAERRERPQGAREPRVEHVRILLPTVPFWPLDTGVGLRSPVPHGNPVTPPQLARYAPRANVLHPVQVHAAPALREEAHAPTLDNL